MKGASSSPRAAAKNGARNSSPPSVGDSTLLCRCTFGSPGMLPLTTSSIRGSCAAVIETVSPSQLIPSDVQRMWISSNPGDGWISSYPGNALLASNDLDLLQLERHHLKLLAGRHLDVEPAAAAAAKRQLVRSGLRAALAAPD